MAGREAAVFAHLRKPSGAARRPDGSQRAKRPERCLGAAAQLAAVHRTLRHGPALQVQRGGAAADAGPATTPKAAAANRTGLPDRLKAGVEAVSGISLDGVKVHYNSSKPAQLDAHAYAQGSDIHLAPGQERHLPHEAWHVVQQKQGRVKPTLQMKGVAINDDAGLEREADTMGRKSADAYALQRQPPARARRVGAIQRAVVQREPTVFVKGKIVDVGSAALTISDLKRLKKKVNGFQQEDVIDGEIRRRRSRPGLALNEKSAILNLDPSDSAINEAAKLAAQRHQATLKWAAPIGGDEAKASHKDEKQAPPLDAIGRNDRIIILAHGTPAFGDSPPMVAGKTAEQLYEFLTQVGFSSEQRGIIDLSNCTSAWDRKETGSFAARFLKILRKNGHSNKVMGFESFTESKSKDEELEVALEDRETFLAHKTTERYLSTLMNLTSADKEPRIKAAHDVLAKGAVETKAEAAFFAARQDETSRTLTSFYARMSVLLKAYLSEAGNTFKEKTILDFQINAKKLMQEHKLDLLGSRIKKVKADPLMLRG